MAHAGNTIDIIIRSVYHQVHTLDVNETSVRNLKQRIAVRDGIPIEQQHLIYGGRVLQNDQLLSSYHIQNGDTLYLVCTHQSMLSFGSLPSLPSLLSCPGVSHSLGASSPPNSLQLLSAYLHGIRREYGANGNHMHEVLRNTFNSPVEIPREEQLAGLLSSTRDMLINQTSQCLLVGENLEAQLRVLVNPVDFSESCELEGDLRHNLNVADPRIRFRTQLNAHRSGRIFYYLGAYFLELSRTMMQVEIGGSRRTATVNVGPSLYITDDLRPNPLSIQGEGYTFVSPRQINILYNLYLAELHHRQISNRSSFPTESIQNMSFQLQHEQDTAIIRQQNNTELMDALETATPGATTENVTGNMETDVSSRKSTEEYRSAHESSSEPSDEKNSDFSSAR